MFYSAWNFSKKPQTINNVLLCIKGTSLFLKVWSVGHGVLVKHTDSRPPFQTTWIKIQGRDFRISLFNKHQVILSTLVWEPLRWGVGKTTILFCWFKAEYTIFIFDDISKCVLMCLFLQLMFFLLKLLVC